MPIGIKLNLFWIFFLEWKHEIFEQHCTSFPLIPFSPNNWPKSGCSSPLHFFILQRTLRLKIFYSYDVLFSCQPGFLSLSALLNSSAVLNSSESVHMKTWSPQSCHLSFVNWAKLSVVFISIACFSHLLPWAALQLSLKTQINHLSLILLSSH